MSTITLALAALCIVLLVISAYQFGYDRGAADVVEYITDVARELDERGEE